MLKDMITELLKMGVIPDSELQPLIDRFYTTILVDRTIIFEYPRCTSVHPNLETTGPDKFDVIKLKSYLHPGQKDGGVIAGNEIYKELEKGLIENCLNLADIMAIKSRGSRFFRRNFAGKELPAWKSVFKEGSSSQLSVPLLSDEGSNGILIKINWLEANFSCTRPALIHHSPK